MTTGIAHIRQLRPPEIKRIVVEEEALAEETSECGPNDADACLKPSVSDYDCERGGVGSLYNTYGVTVVGVDNFDLVVNVEDIGCEAK